MKPPECFEHVIINSCCAYLFIWVIYALVNTIPHLWLALLLVALLFALYVSILRKVYRRVSIKSFCKHVVFNLGVAVFSLSGTFIIKYAALKMVFGEYMSLMTTSDINMFFSDIDFIFVLYFLIIIVLHCAFYEWYLSRKKKSK